jgi:hypothetical protein
MFKTNKYSKFYYSIVSNAKQLNRAKRGNERHHILPRSLGGTDIKSNLVNLTPREHYICHLLLTKFTCGSAYQNMSYALHRITNHSAGKIKSSKMYAMIRKAHADMLSSKLKGVSIMERFGKTHSHDIGDYQKSQIRKSNSERVWSDESKIKMGESQRKRKLERPESFAKGPFTQAHKDAISKAALGKGEKFTFVHEVHGIFVGTNKELVRAYPSIFDKAYHGAEVWKLSKGQYKSCKGWKVARLFA